MMYVYVHYGDEQYTNIKPTRNILYWLYYLLEEYIGMEEQASIAKAFAPFGDAFLSWECCNIIPAKR